MEQKYQVAIIVGVVALAAISVFLGGSDVRLSPMGGMFQGDSDYVVSQGTKDVLLSDCNVKAGYEKANDGGKGAGDIYLYVVDIMKKCPNIGYVLTSHDCEIDSETIIKDVTDAANNCFALDTGEKERFVNMIEDAAGGKQDDPILLEILVTGVLCGCCGGDPSLGCCIGCGAGIWEIFGDK